MGNRAVLTFESDRTRPAVGVYIHWNGGRASVRAFLDACRARGYRHPANDPQYAMAGLVGLLREFFGPEGLSVGVGLLDQLDCDNFDNGVYVIGQDWRIVDGYGQGSASLDYTLAPLYGAELEQYDGILAQLVPAAEPVET
jgi:hypothetical protein